MNHPGTEIAAYQYHCIFAFHIEDYNLARRIYQRGLDQSKNLHNVENWKIIRGYLQLLSNVGKITIENKISAAKFANDFELFSKDKRGSNAQIVLIWFLLALTEGKKEVLVEKFESIRNYKKKYLANEENSRMNSFFQILLNAIIYNFDIEQIKGTSREEIDQLLFNPNKPNDDIKGEIMLIESLYSDILMEYLIIELGQKAKPTWTNKTSLLIKK